MAARALSDRAITRRALLAGVAGAACCPLLGNARGEQLDAGPIFSPTGPNAEHYGAAQGYPVPNWWARLQGNPYPPEYRVGGFSHLDEVLPTRRVARSDSPWAFKRAAADIRYQFHGKSSSLADYLARNAVTGLLIAKDDTILYEHYQYGRTDRDRLVSQSMVKSITGLLVGIAIADGAIKSVDDTPEMYVAGFRDSEYGKTPIRDLLHMSSGVEFGEDEDDGRDLKKLWRDMIARSWFFGKGTIDSLIQFNRRIAPTGTRFHYASIEPDVLGVVLHQATGKTLSDYLHDKVWQSIGAEADAAWLIDAEGQEVAHFGFNAVLRDYARLGRLLAHDGAWEGKQIIPAKWMADATTVRLQDAYLSPGKATADFGYGYLLWLLPGSRRQFAMFGDWNQRVCIDPQSKLVMVQTSLERGDDIWRLWSALTQQLG
jgi:CubicO group peptidase (beta-lactamase class C family)